MKMTDITIQVGAMTLKALDDEKSDGITHEGQAVPAPYVGRAPVRNRRELALPVPPHPGFLIWLFS